MGGWSPPAPIFSMLFSPTRLAAVSLHALPRKPLSRALGRLARVQRPGSTLDGVIDVYCRTYGVDLADYDVPAAGFETFDAFFTRALRVGARPLDPDPQALLSPADGRLEDTGWIERDGRFCIKGSQYTLGELLGEDQGSEAFFGGQFLVIYLSPRDYHRVHVPVSGRITRCHHVGGTLFPVNRIGLDHVAGLFARNERVAVHQQVDAAGHVCTVMVGAIGVGRITLSFEPGVTTNAGPPWGLKVYTEEDAPTLGRGEELGIFHLGSTVIVLLGAAVHWELLRRPGEAVRMGEALARRASG